MKTKFLAGFIASLIAIVVVVSISLFLTLVIDVEPTKNWFTTTAAFVTIASWMGAYRWLKPKTEPVLDEHGQIIEPQVNQIDDSTFKKAYIRNSNVGLKGGIFLAVLGLPGGILILMLSEDLSSGTSIAGLIICFLFGALGLLVIYKSVRAKDAIKNGSDPLMHAILTNDSSYIVWFYGIVTAVQGNPVKQMNNYRMVIFPNDKKKAVSLVVKNEQAYEEILSFLVAKFPNAEKGYTPEIRSEMKMKYGFKA